LWQGKHYPQQPRHIGEHIKKRRFDLKMPAHECQRILGVDKGTLSDWEHGVHKPCQKYSAKIIKFLGYTP
jgi:DNA-binding transcriptional regulator YiaG